MTEVTPQPADPSEVERIELIDEDWTTNPELEDAVAAVKGDRGVETMMAGELARLLPEHLRQTFWEDAVKYYLHDAVALAEAAVRDGWGPPGDLERLRAERDEARATKDMFKERVEQAERDWDASRRERDEARAEAEGLKRERDQLLYERRLLGFARRTLDLVVAGPQASNDWDRARREAADIAQRIVDEIGHPVTDEDALGPSFREQIAKLTEDQAELRGERDKFRSILRLANKNTERRTVQRDEARAEVDRLRRERDEARATKDMHKERQEELESELTLLRAVVERDGLGGELAPLTTMREERDQLRVEVERFAVRLSRMRPVVNAAIEVGTDYLLSLTADATVEHSDTPRQRDFYQALHNRLSALDVAVDAYTATSSAPQPDVALAEVDRMRPVVEAAQEWREGHAPADRHAEVAWMYSDTENALLAAVDIYTAQQEPDTETVESVSEAADWIREERDAAEARLLNVHDLLDRLDQTGQDYTTDTIRAALGARERPWTDWETVAVHLADINRTTSESYCHRCNGPNIIWSAPSPLWNQVMRGGDINGTEIHAGIVCPTCFAQLAEQSGIGEIWRLSAERVHVELEAVTPSGRVWNPQTWKFEEPNDSDSFQRGLTIPALTTEGEDPPAAVQYAAVLPDGARIAYGDQSYVRWGEVLKDHPEARIELRLITITYGEWRVSPHHA